MKPSRILWGLLVLGLAAPAAAAEGRAGVIRLAPRQREPAVDSSEARRGFDYESFESRLESLWFRRRALLAQGREHDAQRHSELILRFLAEEGVTQLEPFASALLVEAQRHLTQGNYEAALDAIEFADFLDPRRPQVALARAATLWHMGKGVVAPLREMVRGWLLGLERGVRELRLLPPLIVALVLALGAAAAVFSVVMLVQYQGPLRHEIEEWCLRHGKESWAPALGWLAVCLPWLLWLTAPWFFFYAVAVTFRFMRRVERWAAALLLGAVAISPVAFRGAVALYEITADPTVRTVMEAARGGYSPDRIVRVQALVNAHPDNPTYRFLLAGLYADGRYFEEAYQHYRKVLELEPNHAGAYINLGNLFYRLGQYAEAIAAYRRAAECDPRSALAYFNLYVAQSEAFRFREAEESLRQAQSLDREATTRWLTQRLPSGEARLEVQEARIPIASVWRAALAGVSPEGRDPQSDGPLLAGLWGNPVSLLAAAWLVGFAVAGSRAGRSRAARLCVRCGRPFCARCRRVEQGEAYCSQCLHLFVVGDGLAPESKTRKLYEIRRHEGWRRWSRRIGSLLVPGTGNVLQGGSWSGLAWTVAFCTALWLAWPSGLVRLAHGVGVSVPLETLRPTAVPAYFDLPGLTALARCAAVGVWAWCNRWVLRLREA